MKRKIYLASSWRNPNQPKAVELLRAAGHEVYDFRNPPSGSPGFAWSPIDPSWMSWTPERFVKELDNPIAKQGFRFDKEGLDWCDTCVLLSPCGKSAHLEAGYAIGWGKPTLIVLDQDKFEPELMYLLADAVVPSLDDMLPGLEQLRANGEVIQASLDYVYHGGSVKRIKEELVQTGAMVIRNLLNLPDERGAGQDDRVKL